MKKVEVNKLIHDIKNNINSINGFLKLALNNIEDKGKIKEYLNNVSISSNFILDLIDYNLSRESLDFLDKINLFHFFNEIKDSFKNELNNKKINFNINIDDVIHQNVYVNDILFKQIFQNLISNSIKYSNNNGLINIFIKEEIYKKRSKFKFIVEDFGKGIEKKFIPKVFKMYKRETNDKLGHGIGLSIVKQNVSKLNGNISVESKKNEYTRFIIEILLDVVDDKVRNILVIDDNEMNINLIKSFFIDSKYNFIYLSNPFDVIELIRKDKNIDLMFVDINLGGMNGIDLIKKINFNKNIIKICMSGNVNKNNFKKYKRKGFDDYLPKPFTFDNIVNLIEKY